MTALRLPPGHALAGKYSVRAPLGYGGASATYAAVLASGRPVVVKLFSPQLADRSNVLSALQRAAGVTNALPADATAPILDVGFDPQTRSPFTATEQMTLPSLLEAVRAGPMAPADVAVVLRGVGLAVDAAHAQRLAHGGLKPQNVFVGPPTGPGQRPVKVIDFGVSVARAALPTDEGRWVAAPWIAPEQMQGAPDGPAADVFSAGLLAFFAATGRSYWRSCQGPTPDLASWQQEILAARVPPGVRALEMGVQLPPGFDVVLARALALDPASRQGSVGELANALAAASAASHAAVAGLPAQPPAAPPPAQAVMAVEPGDGPPRSRTGLFVGLAVGAIVLIGAAIAVVAMLRKPAPAVTSGAAPAASVGAAASSGAPVASVPASVAAAAETVPDAAAIPVAENEAAAPESAQLTVQCVPDCDTITIDDEVLDAGLADPQTLAAGAHTIAVAKATYLSQTRKITLKAGQKEKASFFLSRPGPVPSKPCGKFLERCP